MNKVERVFLWATVGAVFIPKVVVPFFDWILK
jgi:hypothetical protein